MNLSINYLIALIKIKLKNSNMQFDNKTTLYSSCRKAVESGVAGSQAMMVNVTTLMWLNTIVNYQYYHGTHMKDSIETLYRNGGIRRFYTGFIPTLMHGSTSRFCDFYSHSLSKHICQECLSVSTDSTLNSVILSAGISSGFRSILTPLETVKLIYQIDGNNATDKIKKKIKAHGLKNMWSGSGAVMTANFFGYIPWFYTFETLDKNLPKYESETSNIIRNGTIGFTSSVVSDVLSNFTRVVKTIKQNEQNNIKYTKIITKIVKEHGIHSLFYRGLNTKILTNGLQSITFTIMWKIFNEN